MADEPRKLDNQTEAAILYFADRLRYGFTGGFCFRCEAGKILTIQPEPKIRIEDLAKKRSNKKQLSDGARSAILHFTSELREGFTGRFYFECFKGGVRSISPAPEIPARDLVRT